MSEDDNETNSNSGGTRKSGARKHKGWHDGWVSTGNRISLQKVYQDEDPSAVDLPDLIVTQSSIKDEKALDRGKNDIDPHEEAVDEELMLSTQEKKRAALITSRAQVKHILTANQQLRSAWSYATIAEMTSLMKACGRIIRASDSTFDQREVAALVMVMTWTGSTIQQAKRLIWISETGNLSPSFGYKASDGQGLWYVKPQTIAFSQPTLGTDATHARPRSALLKLPDYFKVGRYLQLVFVEETSQKHSHKIFLGTVASYRKRLRELIKSLPAGHRLNEHKISNYLAHHIHTIGSGDIADSMLITGKYRPLGQTLLHYTTPSVTYLQNLYRQVTARMVKDIYCEGYDHVPPTPEVTKEHHDVAVGTRYCPRLDAVQAMTLRLKKQLSTAPEHRISSICEYHNQFTLYTCQMIAYATGFRAVTDPFFRSADIDENTGMAVISDKDGPDMYNSRLVWVPPVARKQIRYYESHCEKILAQMSPFWDPEQINSVAVLGGAYFLDEDLKPISVRPSTAKSHLAKLLPLPLNVNRRFLRTMLKERKTNIEAINAFLGHWSRGEEPWGRFSSVSPVALIEELKPQIVSLLVECGFEEVKSKLR